MKSTMAASLKMPPPCKFKASENALRAVDAMLLDEGLIAPHKSTDVILPNSLKNHEISLEVFSGAA